MWLASMSLGHRRLSDKRNICSLPSLSRTMQNASDDSIHKGPDESVELYASTLSTKDPHVWWISLSEW
jgi:hypothetical protein